MRMESQSGKRWVVVGLLLGVLLVHLSPDAVNAQRAGVPRMKARITSPAPRATVVGPVDFIATVENGTPPFTYTWKFRRGTPACITTTSNLPQNLVSANFGPGRVFSALLTVSDSRTPRPARRRARVAFTMAALPPPGTVSAVSINSTSANLPGPGPAPIAEQPVTGLPDFQVLAANDLGMHCGDLDHRVASILPPFNVVRAQVIQKGDQGGLPQILTDQEVLVNYSAASNPQDPALQAVPPQTIFKTNFWDLNPRGTGNILAFDAYEPFYPPSALTPGAMSTDTGLPVPDLATGAIHQQSMAGVAVPYAANDPQPFTRFDVDLPFFAAFPFGYNLTGLNWFSADGVPITPFDDAGRKNPYPLLRIQPEAAPVNTLGVAAGTRLATVDAVVPVSAEADCFRCHTSPVDGGNGLAACLADSVANCPPGGGSPRSATEFNVVRATNDPNFGAVPLDVSREWAADLNIVRLHDAKHLSAQGGVSLESTTPVVCQRCHYTPALDLLQVGPQDTANGRRQANHQTNSRVLHAFHARMTDLFLNDMPPPNDPLRFNAQAGKPVVNALVQGKLNESCYQCHPGRVTQCLRGAMFNGGLVCQDCHGSMQQVGDDFSQNLSEATPFPGGADLTKRVPWASEPKCQSCHTGDALDNLTGDPNVIPSSDGIRLLQAYRTGDAAATPIVAANRRFAENNDAATGNHILYRLSKEDNHAGLFCQSCHGSTHAEWPVQPSSGQFMANDNLAALQLQGHAGTIAECTTCHATGTAPLGLAGPHGLHPLGDARWVDPDTGHRRFLGGNGNACRACHGLNGEGTVLARVTAARSFNVEGRTVNLEVGRQVSCTLCHGNKL
jgi:hypothetical protein